MPMPKYLRNLDGTAGKPRLSEGTMLSEGPVNDCIGCLVAFEVQRALLYTETAKILTAPMIDCSPDLNCFCEV